MFHHIKLRVNQKGHKKKNVCLFVGTYRTHPKKKKKILLIPKSMTCLQHNAQEICVIFCVYFFSTTEKFNISKRVVQINGEIFCNFFLFPILCVVPHNFAFKTWLQICTWLLHLKCLLCHFLSFYILFCFHLMCDDRWHKKSVIISDRDSHSS